MVPPGVLMRVTGFEPVCPAWEAEIITTRSYPLVTNLSYIFFNYNIITYLIINFSISNH
jgi:hypothetical protein